MVAEGCFVVDILLHVVATVMRVLCLYSPGFVVYIFVHVSTVKYIKIRRFQKHDILA